MNARIGSVAPLDDHVDPGVEARNAAGATLIDHVDPGAEASIVPGTSHVIIAHLAREAFTRSLSDAASTTARLTTRLIANEAVGAVN